MDHNTITRILPNDILAEQSVIASMIKDNKVISTMAESLNKDDFYSPKYSKFFEIIVKMHDEGQVIDVVTFRERLKEEGVPEDYYALENLKDLVMSVSTTAYCKSYAKIVSDKAVLRGVIKTADEISSKCYSENDNVEDILEETEKKIYGITQKQKANDIVGIKQMVMEVLNDIETASKNHGSITGIPTGFYELDYMTAGLQKSDLILLAARPSMGKTALALNIAYNVICKSRIPTVFFSLEMSGKQLTHRLISMHSEIDSHKIRTGNLATAQWGKLVESARDIGEATLVIDDTPSISVKEMRSKCRKLKMEMGLGLIIIDYLQLMTTGNSRSESRQNEISEISRSLKAIAREMQCPVLALSQLSRDVEKREDKRPVLSDLRESGAIEQDADVVMFIYRDEYYKPDSADKGIAEVLIRKHRNGPVGKVKLGYKLELAKFVNLIKDDKGKITTIET